MSQNIIHCPPNPNFTVNPKGMGFAFMEQMKKNKSKIAQIDGETGVFQTYDELLTQSIRVAQHLKARGATKRDIISTCAFNVLDSYAPYLASLFLGIPIASLDPSLPLTDTTHMLKLVQPKFIFCSPEAVDLVANALKSAGFPCEIIVFGDLNGYTPFSEFTGSTGTENDFECEPVDLHDTAIIFFSSGTTGLAKAVCNTHYGILSQLQFFQPNKEQDSDSFINPNSSDDLIVFFYFTTLYWVSATMIFLISTLSGTARLLSKTFDEGRALKLIEKYKVSLLFVSPYYMHCFLKYPDLKSYDVSSLKKLLVGGGLVTQNQILALRELFPEALVINGYGMTEVGGITGFNLQKDYQLIMKKPGSVGRPIPGLSYKLVNPETEEIVGPHEHGEIRVKSDRCMKEYFKNPHETAQAWDSEGYLCTGDIGYYDEDQCFFIVDRLKEMLKYKSWHITPAELEAILLTHPDVKEAAVLGRPHEVHGELPTGLIVLKPGSSTTKTDILTFFNDQVPDRKKLRGGIEFVDNLHYTPSGKLKRRYLKQILL